MAITTMQVKDGAGALRVLRMSQAADGSLAPAPLLVSEVKTEADLSGGSLTLSAAPSVVRILNEDATYRGVFTVNGIPFPVPANGGSIETGVLGTPSATVTVTGSTVFSFQVLV